MDHSRYAFCKFLFSFLKTQFQGEITTLQSLDQETQGIYTLTVTATDNEGGSDSRQNTTTVSLQPPESLILRDRDWSYFYFVFAC